ncbi:hypothetical protein ACWEN6_06535 [Sphaerisporangium sp. NPDC004334]
MQFGQVIGLSLVHPPLEAAATKVHHVGEGPDVVADGGQGWAGCGQRP